MDNSAKDLSPPPVAPAEIARRAYDIWIAKGRPEGAAVEHWLMAEDLLKAERLRDAGLALRREALIPPRTPASPPRSVTPRTRTETPALTAR